MEEINFIDEMLAEIEAKEEQMQLAHVDMVLKEIGSLNTSIEKIFFQAEEEKAIITEWAIQRNAKLQDRAELLTKKLELFMSEQDPATRTIDLPNGQLLRRKQVQKLVVEDLVMFMENSNLSQLTTTAPEVVKPDLSKIKTFYKMSGKVPKGCSLVESTDKFSIKLKGGVNGTSKNGTTGQSTDED